MATKCCCLIPTAIMQGLGRKDLAMTLASLNRIPVSVMTF